jgi:hypothetical protein
MLLYLASKFMDQMPLAIAPCELKVLNVANGLFGLDRFGLHRLGVKGCNADTMTGEEVVTGDLYMGKACN